MKTQMQFPFAVLCLGLASASFAAPDLPVNPGLIDAMRPAQPRSAPLPTPQERQVEKRRITAKIEAMMKSPPAQVARNPEAPAHARARIEPPLQSASLD